MFAFHVARAEQMLDDMLRTSTALVDALDDADAAAARVGIAWAGETADAHRGAHERWRGDARRMARALDEMRGALQGAYANYSAAASVNLAMWG
ncbi:WXG100 family type VII secretion target [Microbacterium sp. C5A9]|uniref:WXG100 family type VII secretion target n=1 Tax=Microbacterium sp. C5A9 TaxID=2736663 RepID=UPI001F527D11|nr:WXG100 family type VII secretion target [Microbacterium sp. C5A9]MCI1018873.1 WXG100 family type VII secretion target [Microbacterium sp. C5A9]